MRAALLLPPWLRGSAAPRLRGSAASRLRGSAPLQEEGGGVSYVAHGGALSEAGGARRRHHEIPIRALAFVFGDGSGTSDERPFRVERTVRQRPRALVLFPISLGGIGAPTRLGALELA